MREQAMIGLRKFLSTPSARRATCSPSCRVSLPMEFLSTPSARRATGELIHWLHYYLISIHALREEGDAHGQALSFCPIIFLSTPSARRATNSASVLHTGFVFLSTPSARRATFCV